MEEKFILIQQCATCKTITGIKMVKQGEDDLVSHGYCKKCLDAEKEAIKNRRLLKKLDAISQDFNHKFELFKNRVNEIKITLSHLTNS
ncbi:MAG: hypothetical protein HRT90_05710 [Candidatus Margulisbacteria bacterium]|nr:hypothetical protein [Candidatus Margulisiibacteriota bacterium]